MKGIGNQAFASCKELTDVYCLAEEVPSTHTCAFQDAYIEYVTLHVPTASIDAYKAVEPWKNFKSIVGLDGTIDTPKCATPTIAFVNGKLKFTCSTDSVDYVSEITSKDVKKYYGDEVKPIGIYTISVYATRPGWEDSDVATMEFTLGNDGEVCDVNKDGAVDVADIATIIDKMASGARMQEETEE